MSHHLPRVTTLATVALIAAVSVPACGPEDPSGAGAPPDPPSGGVDPGAPSPAARVHPDRLVSPGDVGGDADDDALMAVRVCTAAASPSAHAALPPGFLDASTFAGVYPNDPTKDSTTGLRNAMQAAFRDHKTLYLPARTTYTVSDSLVGVQPPSPCGDPEGRSYRLHGGGRGAARPKIVLKDGSPGFGAGSGKKLVWIGKDSDGDGVIDGAGASCAFGHQLQNVDLVLGKNPGAIGVAMNIAQEGTLENVRIDATGAYAGISGVPGRSTAVGNITIVGGDYGFRFDEYPVGIMLYGIRLLQQEVRAISGMAARPFTIVGLRIDKATGPAIETAGSREPEGHLGIYDARISLAQPGTVIANGAARMLDLREVYVQNASTLVEQGASSVPGSGAGWSKVRRYGFCPTSIGGGKTCWNLLEGVKGRELPADIVSPSAAPPGRLLSQHIPPTTPDVLDPTVLWVTDAPYSARPGAGDVRAKIQDAIDSTEPGMPNAGKSVFVPPGVYDLSGPIVLRSHTHLFGVLARDGGSDLHALDTWTQSLTGPAWIFETSDDAAATTSLEFVRPTWRASYSKNGIWMGAVRWRAGRSSVVRAVRPETAAGRCEDRPRHIWRIEGRGGGRFYTWMEGLSLANACATAADMDRGFRKLVVEGTTEPLTFYGPDPEHGGKQSTDAATTFLELKNAKNVRFLGQKVETNGPLATIAGSQNVFFGGVVAIGASETPFFHVDASRDVELAHVAAWGGSATTALIAETGMGPTETVLHDAEIGAYRRGTVNWAAWPTSFSACP